MTHPRTSELIYWINTREKLRKGEPVTDILMTDIRYCNVRREDDKVTQWLARYWRPQHHSTWELFLARSINWIPTLKEVLIECPRLDDLSSVARLMKERRDQKMQVWGNAYTVSTNGNPMDKVDYIMRVTQWCMDEQFKIAHVLNNNPPTLKEAYQRILQVRGIGSFMAGQIVADMKNTTGHPLEKAADWWTWSTHGPGSLLGLTRFFGYRVTPLRYEKHILEAYVLVKDHIPPIHMQDFQNCLCEFSKYMRAKDGGHVRNKYRPGAR
jgi:hypothetical protein